MNAGNLYSTSTSGIGGQIKRLYRDFVVEEITENGKVCRTERFLADEFKEKQLAEIPKKENGKDQLHLDLEKINKDLNFVIRKIARFLQCSRKRIGYAGLKDKRAVTCQRISIFKPNVERLQAFTSSGIELRNAEWDSERIRLGSLKGNRFTITIRDIDLDEKELKKRISSCFKEIKEGIANYFGEQRFGGIRQVTHLVGREFVKGNIKGGVMLFLTHASPLEEEDVGKARENLLKSNDFSQAIREFPPKYRYERAIIHHLCRYPNDFVGAFGKLPKQLRYLFTHAYQSYLFNKVIDERLRLGIGLKRVRGDILVEGVPSASLYGFESELASCKVGDIERKVLEEENLETSCFKVKSMPELSSKGSRRAIVLVPEKLRLDEIGEDELFPGKRFARLSFTLHKGCYATTVLRELMKID